jgi:hypothetical protein
MINIFKLFTSCLTGIDNNNDSDSEESRDDGDDKLSSVAEPAIEPATRLTRTLTQTPRLTQTLRLRLVSDLVVEKPEKLYKLFYSHELYKKTYIHEDQVDSYYKKLYPRAYLLIKAPSFRLQDPNDYRASLP